MLILLVLLIAIVGLTISTVSAATKTTGKIYFKDGKHVSKNIGKGDYIYIYYGTKESPEQGFYSANTMRIFLERSNGYNGKYYKLVKSTVNFRKKVNGKYVYSTKTFKATIDDFRSKTIWYNPKNGYKPYYAIVTYKNK